jgi:hypothetical protein
METIGKQTLRSFDTEGRISTMTCASIRNSSGLYVRNFRDLAARVAELQFRNRDFVLLYRGQNTDHKNRAGNTTIRPSILRHTAEAEKASSVQIARRFGELAECEATLIGHIGNFISDRETRTRLRRERILRWSILQHYEICPTPLLDVTHSLRVAASFASDESGDEAFVFALGLPNLSGAVTASVEAGLQIVRLASVCPAVAMRPHIQEGYLLGEYPEVSSADQKGLYESYELDFGRRLLAKFRFNPKSFWSDREFPLIERPARYPEEDPLAQSLRPLRSPV